MRKAKNYIIFTLSRRMYFESGADYKWYKTYYTRKQLIYKLAVNYGKECCILNHLSKDMSEKSCEYRYVKNRYVYGGYMVNEQKLYFLAKEKNNSIEKLNINSMIKEVIETHVKLAKKAEKRSKRLYAERKRYESYEFRRGPVSGIHNYKRWHRGTYYRHPKTARSKRLNYVEAEACIKDVKIKLLPSVYDDLVRHRDKSWKTSCKVRKQWQKHLNK